MFFSPLGGAVEQVSAGKHWNLNFFTVAEFCVKFGEFLSMLKAHSVEIFMVTGRVR